LHATCSILDAVSNSTFRTVPLGAGARLADRAHDRTMTLAIRSFALVLALSGCLVDRPPGGSGPSGDPGPGPGSSSPPPKPVPHRGKQTMSDVHVQPDGTQVWIVHSAIADTNARVPVVTAHLGAYLPASQQYVEVLDTTGTLGKKVLFPGSDRVLYVTHRGIDQDVFVSLDTVARKPLVQHTHWGDLRDFQLSPSGRFVVAVDAITHTVHAIDTAQLIEQKFAGATDVEPVVWAHGGDLLYRMRVTNTAGGATTDVLRYDLRGAAPDAPLPAPAVIASLAGSGVWPPPVISGDDRYLAATVGFGGVGVHVALVDLATGAVVTAPSDMFPAFTRDHRAVTWRVKPGSTHDLALIDPATGAAVAPPVATELLYPTAIPLRDHDIVLVSSLLFEDGAFLYRTSDGARTPTADLSFVSSQFERPGHPEVWMWFEYEDTLRRLDLTTGAAVNVIFGADSVDYRAATDDIVVGTFDHSVHLYSMATGTAGPELALPDPNDVAAPYRLTAE
jgi:hypothetical protein